MRVSSAWHREVAVGMAGGGGTAGVFEAGGKERIHNISPDLSMRSW